MKMGFNLFQWIVDATQKMPQWWCRQCLVASFMAGIMKELLDDGPFTGMRCLWILFGAFVFALAFMYMSSDAHTAALGAFKKIRVVSWWFNALLLIVFLAEPAGYKAAALMREALFAALFSFAACHPPAPPRRRQKLAFGGSA